MPNLNQDWNIVIVPDGEQLLTQHLGISTAGAIEALTEVLATYLGMEGRLPLLVEPRDMPRQEMTLMNPQQAAEKAGLMGGILWEGSPPEDPEVRAAWLEAGGQLPGVA